MKLKAIFSAALAAAVMATTTTAMTASALEVTADKINTLGDSGEIWGYDWGTMQFVVMKIDNNDELWVSRCSDYDGSEIVIPDTVNGISVTCIGNNAFYECTGITSITIPNSVTSFDNSAFMRCTDLTNITIPNSVEYIGSLAFYGCKSLTSITIPDSVIGIGHDAFNGCEGLTGITIPKSVTSIGILAFAGTNITDIYYEGTEKQWNEINNGSIGKGITLENLSVPNATLHFNSTGPAPSENSDFDLDGDKTVNIFDVIYLLNKIAAGSTDPAYDLNGDGHTNILDVLELLKILAAKA